VRQWFGAVLLAVFLLCHGTPVAAQDASPDFTGRPIANISFSPASQPLEGSQLYNLLPIRAGQSYSADAIRDSIAQLFATGRYADIQVDATPAPNGVSLVFITRNSWFVGNVSATVDFAEPPNVGQIVNSSRLQLGQPFDESQVSAAVTNIQHLLIDNGYFDAKIDPQLRYDVNFQQVHINFVVTARRRARYERPKISGDTAVLTENDIIKATRWRRFVLPGYRGITGVRTHTGIDNIQLKYQNANRLFATVTLKSIDPDGRNGKPHIEVEPGPTVRITTPGVSVSKKQLRESVPIYEEHTVDADLLNEGRVNLQDYFQAQGYFDVGVDFKETQVKDGVTEISYIIEKGKRHRLVYLQIQGNKFFDQKTIRERLFMSARSFEFRNGRYSEAFLRRDIASIEDLYQSNGFREVMVTSKTVDDYQGRDGDLAVFLTIVEGPQYFVASLNIKGAEKPDLGKVYASLNSQPGQIFSEFNVAADRERIIAFYGDNGFPDATFEWTSRPAEKPHTVDLEFSVDQGRQQFVRQVVTTGLEITKPTLVNKQIQLNPSDPLSPSKMADTQRKLYDLGIFSQVNMAIQNPDGDEDRKYVVYDLEEAHRYSINTGFGLQFARIGGSNAITDLSDPGGAPGVSPRVSVALNRLNLFGRAQTVTIQGVLSTLQRRAVSTYFVPRIFGWQKFDGTFSLLYDNTFDVRTFRSKREEGIAKLTQHYSRSLTFIYDFTYRHVDVSDLKIDPLLLPQLAQSVRVGIAEFSVIQDRRDDPLDPHKGIYNTVNLGVAADVFGSQTGFVRLLARNATYHRIGEKLVLARETQFGMEPAFSVLPNSEPDDPIPLAERFFGGGGNTLRGFSENQAGPRDLLTGFPLGGSALLFNNTELRFPLRGANISGVLFEDAGNIYPNVGAISFRTNQRNIQDFDYMVHAAGFGIRYRTPIGPLRFDIAYSINPPKYNGFPGSYSQLVQCSAAGTCQASPQQISHFQFFFSIGQAF
jgi:outer membrane protein assembly complex protein YaeT